MIGNCIFDIINFLVPIDIISSFLCLALLGLVMALAMLLVYHFLRKNMYESKHLENLCSKNSRTHQLCFTAAPPIKQQICGLLPLYMMHALI